ncbi:PUM3 protein, partial [Fregetta grallaria]|nr:PUM3 protein [Fregetta grallaria]
MEAKGKKKFVGKSGKAPRGKVPHGKRKFKKDNDLGPPKKLLNKGDEEGKPKSISKTFVKGQCRPGRASVKQFKNKHQSEKLAKKRKLQDGEEGGEQTFKLGYQWKLGFGKHTVHLGLPLYLFTSCYHPSKLAEWFHLAFAHDSTRVIQCFIQYGNEKQRQETFEELKDSLVELSKSKYSRNIVKKFLMYGTKPQVAEIIKSFKGHVKKMLRHAEASAVVEYAYNDKAILEQRNMLTEELYGNTFQVYKTPVVPTLDKVLEAQPEKRGAILDEMKQILTPMAQKEAVIKHSLVHKVFLDFFTYALPKQRSEMIEAIREAVVYLAHTHDGARVAMHCLWHGTPK